MMALIAVLAMLAILYLPFIIVGMISNRRKGKDTFDSDYKGGTGPWTPYSKG